MANIHLFRAMVTSAATAFVGSYDSITGINVAYGLRRMRSSYTGSLIRVQRSSDSTQLDIDYLADGSLDTTTMLAFVGTGNGFVVTWYDQSGSAFNAVSTGLTCFIAQAGVLCVEGSKAVVRVINSNIVGFTIPLAAVAVVATAQVHSVHKQLPTGGGGGVARGGAWRIGVDSRNTTHKWVAGDNIYDAFMLSTEIAVNPIPKQYNVLSSIAVTRNAAGLYSFYDANVFIASGSTTPSNTPTNAGFPNTGNGDCVCAEFVFLGAVSTSGDRATIDSNMRGYYEIV